MSPKNIQNILSSISLPNGTKFIEWELDVVLWVKALKGMDV